MIESAVQQLKSRKAEVRAQIQKLEKEVRGIEKALAALTGLGGKAPAAATAAAPKKRRKMSKLGQLKIKLGSLNRYGHKDAAKKVQAQIDALLAKAKQ